MPGGEAAPMTPRGTPQEAAGEGGVPDAAVPEVGDTAMDGGPGGEETAQDVEMDFVGSLKTEGEIGRLEPSVDDAASSMILQQIGSLGRSYRREARQGARKLVSEIYSPPRVTEMIRKAKMRHIMPGFALDITVNDPLLGNTPTYK